MTDTISAITFRDLWKKPVDWMAQRLPTLLFAVLVFVAGWLLIKLVIKMLSKGLKKTKLDVTLHAFIKSLVNITLIVLLAITCAGMLGLPMTSVVTALGAVGLALSLAVKDGLSNLAGGLVLLVSKPFAVGDYIAAEGIEGTVGKIDLVHTMLHTVDNKKIFIPNGQMSNAKIVNYSAEPVRRLDLEFSIGYQSDVELAKAVVRGVIERHPATLKEPPPLVRLLRHGDHALVIVSRVWVEGSQYWSLHYDMMEQVKHGFDEAGITIPYNQLDVHFANRLSEKMKSEQ